MSVKNSTKRYQKKDPISHCLDRPDMYVGSIRMRDTSEYIASSNEEGEYSIYNKQIQSSPAILRIFIEALSNAIDNVERSRGTRTPCTTIKVTIDQESGETSIWNDGDVVPIEVNEDEGVYNHTMIFGQLLTGSNYNDEEERIIAGRNGIGIKACNIFSSEFTVTGCDPKKKKCLTQTWTNNMRDIGEAEITDCNEKGFTEVRWTPDFSRFGLDGYTDDLVALYKRYVIDAAMLSKIQVYLNDELIPIRNLSQYANLYNSPTDEKLLIKTKTSEVLVSAIGVPGYETVSFVNGVYTRLGGQHVDAWSEALFRPIVDKFNGKDKKTKTKTPKINIADVKNFFRLFVVSTVVRPEFDGQDKNKLESPAVETQVKPSHITTICKWSVMESIEDIIKTKEMMVLKKAERGKKKVKVEGLDPANNAGGKFSSDCSLFVCEGLSAKTYVVAGIDTGVYGKQGRDWFGVLPVTGKVLNVRNATPTAITMNKVIVSFIQTTGLRHDVDYTVDANFKTLSYGKVIIVADADVDGIHIEGLIMNLIHSMFPTLLNREESYIIGMKTPIARVFGGKGEMDKLFYDERRFNDFLSKQTKKINAKYYKGLGTTREEDVPDTFGLKMVEYVNDEFASMNMNKVFHKKHADARKEWLEGYNPATYSFSLDDQDSICQMNLSNFLNGEMIKFSHADCARSLPHMVDGLKESQRKILYAVFKRNLKFSGSSLKVAQLSGYTAEHSNYHHGEQNLQDTIINMASGFPGANNIPLLYPDGGFGTRLEGGKDAASARYIYTKLEGMTEYIFKSDDLPLLTQVNDDGDLVQPEYYIPIIPMILVNGCTAGIGTGWSCTVPCYNPLDLVEAIRTWLENDHNIIVEDPDTGIRSSLLTELNPWYRGFKGDISKSGDNRFTTEGIVEENTKTSKKVTELPIGLWTNKFKEFCEDLVAEKKLKSMKNYSTTRDVEFILTESPDGLSCNKNNLKLESYVYTSNMVMFNEDNQLRKYDMVDEIINEFCEVRYDYYIRRKKYQIGLLENEIRYLTNKQRFVQAVINEELQLMNMPEDMLIEELKSAEYDEEPNCGGYDYLLRMQVRTFTAEKVAQLDKDIDNLSQKLETLQDTTEEQIWLNELDEFEKKYSLWLKDMGNRVPKKKGKSKK
jgi:DNA topoisomerase-2